MKNLIKKLCLILSLIFVLFTFSSCFIDTENSNSNNNQEEIEQIDFSDLTYIAFGDSITYGSDCYNALAQMEYPYPKLVASELGLKSYINYGVVASTIATNVDNLPSIYNQVINANQSANIISIMGGVNDYNRNVEIGTVNDVSTITFYGALNTMCNELIKKYPNSFIFFMTPYKEYPYQQITCDTENSKGYILEDYANAIKQVCNNYHIPVLDMFTYGNFDLEFSASGSDGIHPSQEFIRNYTAPQIAQFIKDNYTDTPNYTIPKQIDFSNLTYIAYGDSITYGTIFTSNGYKRADTPYPNIVADILGVKGFINKGVGGSTSKDICSHIDNTVETADIITVMCGVNDRSTWRALGTIEDTTDSTVYGSLNIMAQMLKSKFPNAFIVFMTPYKAVGYNSDYYDYYLEDVATAIKRVAFNYDIPVLDMFNVGQFELEMYNEDSDGCHPSQEFFENYTAPQIAQFIKDNY